MDEERRGFPGSLWLFPIFFGLLGGIIASLIADMKYNAGWLELFIVGLILQLMYIAGMFLILVQFGITLFS